MVAYTKSYSSSVLATTPAVVLLSCEMRFCGAADVAEWVAQVYEQKHSLLQCGSIVLVVAAVLMPTSATNAAYCHSTVLVQERSTAHP
jgi:hypothetical protein